MLICPLTGLLMEYTDFNPPAISTGKLGSFVGDVSQDLDSTQKTMTNILDISFPVVRGFLLRSDL